MSARSLRARRQAQLEPSASAASRAPRLREPRRRRARGAPPPMKSRDTREHAGVARLGEQVHQRRGSREVRVLQRAYDSLPGVTYLKAVGELRAAWGDDALEEVKDVERQSHVRDGAHLPSHAVLRGDGRESVRRGARVRSALIIEMPSSQV